MKKTICALVTGLILGLSGCKTEEPKLENYKKINSIRTPSEINLTILSNSRGETIGFDYKSQVGNLGPCLYKKDHSEACLRRRSPFLMTEEDEKLFSNLFDLYQRALFRLGQISYQQREKDK